LSAANTAQVYEHELMRSFPGVFSRDFSPHFVSKACDALQIFFALRFMTLDAAAAVPREKQARS
jgi:hypothetical protein